MARCCAILILAFVTLCRSEDPTCNNQINSCSCETDQGLIDLSPLDSNDPNQAKFSQVSDGKGDDFAYNPCSHFTDISSIACYQVAACQTRGFDTYNIGQQDGATFDTDPTDGLRIKYPTADVRTTYVALECDPSQEGSLTAIGEEPEFSSIYKLKLTSKYCCPSGGGGGGGGGGGLSAGSIMLIIFSILIVVYLIGGVIYNRVAKGASGVELIPNVEFWTALPGLIKEGCLFIWHKITSKATGYQET